MLVRIGTRGVSRSIATSSYGASSEALSHLSNSKIFNSKKNPNVNVNESLSRPTSNVPSFVSSSLSCSAVPLMANDSRRLFSAGSSITSDDENGTSSHEAEADNLEEGEVEKGDNLEEGEEGEDNDDEKKESEELVASLPETASNKKETESQELSLKQQLRPLEVVSELDRHIVGQHDAKRAVAIAMRNRWRRRQLPKELMKEVTPRNVLMIGPTGCGKTEVARRMASLSDAPFLKVGFFFF